MKRFLCFSLLTIIFLATLMLCSCSNEPAPTTSTAPTLSVDAYLNRLSAAITRLEASEHLLQNVSFSETRTVGGQTYTHVFQQNLSFQNIGKRNMKAYLVQNVAFGNYRTTVTEFFIGNNSLLSASGRTFLGPDSAADFVKRQIPAVLFRPNHFSSVRTTVTSNEILLTFDDASVLESWVTELTATPSAISASARMDSQGNLLETTYRAEYRIDSTAFILEVTSSASAPAKLDLTAQVPSIPEDVVKIDSLEAPLMVMQAVGDLLSTRSLYTVSSETIISEALLTSRVQDVRVFNSGTGDDYLARIDYSVSLTDYTGSVTSTLQSLRFQKGSATVSTGGAYESSPLTAEQVRTQCEDVFLMSMFATTYLEQADMEEKEGQLLLSFSGSSEMTENLLQGVYQILGTDLGHQASSYSGSPITGYLVLSKTTGLPTSAGMSVQRTHVIHDVSYGLTYHLEQVLHFPGNS